MDIYADPPIYRARVYLFVFTVFLGPNVRFEDYEGVTSHHKHLPEFVTKNFSKGHVYNNHPKKVTIAELPVPWMVIMGIDTRWWFQIFAIVTLILGEMIHFDGHIFQMGWETTTNWNMVEGIFLQSRQQMCDRVDQLPIFPYDRG